VVQLLSDAGAGTPSTSYSSAPHHHLVERTGALGKIIRLTCASCYAKAKQKGGHDGVRKNSSNSSTHIVICGLDSHRCAENASISFTNEHT